MLRGCAEVERCPASVSWRGILEPGLHCRKSLLFQSGLRDTGTDAQLSVVLQEGVKRPCFQYAT